MPVSTPRGVHLRLAYPLPALRATLEAFDGTEGIDDDLVVVLFLLVRRVRDLLESPPRAAVRWSRAADARSAAANTPEIAAELLLLGSPRLRLTEVNRPRTADACNRIADWAVDNQYRGLALQYASVAVALEPEDAKRTYEAGRIHRQLSRQAEAELYYSRAICLARPENNWWAYIRAHLGLGHIYVGLDEMDRAVAHMSTASRRAQFKSGEKWLAAMIEHDLFVLAMEQREFETAHAHACRALESVPSHNELVPALAHDYAYLLLQTQAPAHARTLLELLVQKGLASAKMVLVWSTLARTAAILGDAERYRVACQEVQGLAIHVGLNTAAAYANLGVGAHVLGLFADADHYATRSLELAKACSELRILRDVEELLAEVRRGNAAPRPSVKDLPEHVDRFVRRLTDRLTRWRGSTWKRTQQSGRARLGIV